MTPIRALPRASLAEQVANELSRLIVDGTFPPESAMPSEGQLAERFGVSRASVREAVKMLAARGLIQVRHGVGLFASGSSYKPVTDALQLLFQREHVAPEELVEVRRLLEVEIAGLAAERATGEDLERIAAALEDLGQLDAPVEAQIAADTEFHVALARAAHNPIYLAVSEAVRQPLAASMRATYPLDGGPAHRYQEHATVFQAVRSRRPADARQAMAGMLETSALALERHARREAGEGAEAGNSSGSVATFEAVAGAAPSGETSPPHPHAGPPLSTRGEGGPKAGGRSVPMTISTATQGGGKHVHNTAPAVPAGGSKKRSRRA